MGDVAQQVHVLNSAPPEFTEMADMAYHIAAQCAPDGIADARELADMLQVGPEHFAAAKREIHDHRDGLCPPNGHHGRRCAEYVASYHNGHG